jgi:hypothetical protein
MFSEEICVMTSLRLHSMLVVTLGYRSKLLKAYQGLRVTAGGLKFPGFAPAAAALL